MAERPILFKDHAELQGSLPVAVWSGSFVVFGVELKCHTLADGRKIIETDSFHQLLAAMKSSGIDCGDEGLQAFGRWYKGLVL
jgi:hypothetical protein